MKKFLALALAFCMIATSMVFVPLTVAAEDATITVTDLTSFNEAVKNVPNGGTIIVNADIVFNQTSNGHVTIGSNTGKTYTITGGSFDFTALSSTDGNRAFIDVKDNITFTSTKFITDPTANDYLFANGYNLTVAEDVAFEGASICFYAGILNKDCGSINFTLLSGNYTTINSTTNSAKNISGDVNIHVGGTATFNNLLGNSGGCTVDGNVNILVDGNATGSYIYGGGNGGTINKNTDVTVAGHADVKFVFGGGQAGTVKGNTKVTVTGNANPNCDPTSHSMTYGVFGGSTVTKNSQGEITKSGTIEGYTEVYFAGEAKANYIWGGCYLGGTVNGGTNITMSGNAKTMSMYGGGYNVAQNCDANVTLLGGTLEQVFGACQNESLTGNVTVKLLGGTISRRVFGGCYNEYANLSWKSSHGVTGNIYVIISENSAITLDFDNDNALSAHSRIKSKPSGEVGHIIFTSSDAKTKYNNKINDGDVTGGAFLGSDISYDYKHLYSYALNGNVITQTCSEHSSHSATATITPAGNTYTGEAINVAIEYSENWEYDQFDVTYANNLNSGTATATLSIDSCTALNYYYDINKLTQNAPSIKIVDGNVTGLTTEMEYSTDGKNYQPVNSDTDLSGKFFIRYQKTENYHASNAVKIYTGVDLTLNAVSGRVNDTVEVIVYAPNYNRGALSLTVNYDDTALTFAGATNGNVLGGFSQEGNVLTWSETSANAKKGTFVKLYFTINEGATGNYEISVLGGEGITTQAGSVSVVGFVHGDVAVAEGVSDGKIDTSDVFALRNALSGDETTAIAAGADVNGDEVVDSKDIVVLRQYIANYDYDAGESTVALGGN